MAHPYTTQSRIELFLGAQRVAELTDRNDDGVLDSGLVTAAIERICNRIDGALAPRYAMPCAGIGDSPATPGQVSDLADLGVGMLLYAWLAPKSTWAERYRVDFEGEDGDAGQLGRFRAGDEDVVGLAERGADTGAGSVAYESIGTLAAGGVDSVGDRRSAWVVNDTTDQTRGI